MKYLLGLIVTATPAICVAMACAATTPIPRTHVDFDHYTFALTWQPGICSTEEGCQSAQPHAPLIGLHGLWASRPQGLIKARVPVQEWWSKGCGHYRSTNAAPPISATLHRQLESVMPQFSDDLLVHEYDKHVVCFGFDPTAFFSMELAMRSAVSRSTFGTYLVRSAGSRVTHAAVVAEFNTTFHTAATTSLQLQCEEDRAGRDVLTQLWITIKASDLGEFPRGTALMNAKTNQDSCPTVFLIPSWPG
jgi:ribonuclease I